MQKQSALLYSERPLTRNRSDCIHLSTAEVAAPELCPIRQVSLRPATGEAFPLSSGPWRGPRAGDGDLRLSVLGA